jgi:molybdopterin synthase catalytic subunit
MPLTTKTIKIDDLLKKTTNKATGACLIFLGIVRNYSENGKVLGITYYAHKKLATKLLAQLEKEVKEKFPVNLCKIVHRLGYLEVGEVSLAIIVSSAHRKEAYRASRYAIEALKKRIPIWKKEKLAKGKEVWVEGKKLEVVKDA